MRYDKEIYFQKNAEPIYNPETGDYEDAQPEENMVIGSVMDSSSQTMLLVYGAIKQGSLTIHIQNHYNNPFDTIRVGEKVYAVDRERRLRTKHVFIVSEVQ